MTTEAAIWPRYSKFTTGDLAILGRFLTTPGHLRSPLIVALLLVVYVGGVFTPLPTSSPLTPTTSEPWWFLALLDSLLTGGALGRGAIFAMGAVALLLFRSHLHKPQHLVHVLLGYGRVALGALVLVAFFRWRGLGEPGIQAFVGDVMLVAIGGVGIHIINRQSILHRGPHLLCVNVCITVIQGILATLQGGAGDRGTIVLLTGIIAFIFVSAYVLFRSSALVDVEEISSVDHRKATVQLSPVDEPLLDSVGTLSLVLYVPVAGLASLLFGWRAVTPDNAPFFIALSLAAFACVWLVFQVASRIVSLNGMLAEESLFGPSNPRACALRMFHNFWVVRGVKPGADTENAIRGRMDQVVTRAFLLFAAWFAIAIATEYYIRQRGALSPFPYGPVVFVLMVLMVVGYFSMLSRHVHAAFSHFKQIMRGRSRVLADTYPLAMPGAMTQLSVTTELERYWQEEKIADHWREVVDWLKIARDMQPLRGRDESGRQPLKARLIGWSAALTVAVVISFLAGAVCVLFYPDLSRRDLVLIILPTLVTTIAAPEPLLRLFRKLSRRG